MTKINGQSIKCTACNGRGIRRNGDECEACGGSGRNWLYTSGAIAKYYSGPFIGQEAIE